MSKLIEEPPLIVLPTLAKAVGLKKAILLQQIHYLGVTYGSPDMSGRIWVEASIPEWVEALPLGDERTMRSYFRELESDGYLDSKQFGGKGTRNAYAVNRQVIERIEVDKNPPLYGEWVRQNLPEGYGKVCRSTPAKIAAPSYKEKNTIDRKRKERKGAGQKSRPRDLVFEALAKVSGIPLQAVDGRRGEINKNAAILRKWYKGLLTDEDLADYVDGFSEWFYEADKSGAWRSEQGVKITPTVVVKHWHAYAAHVELPLPTR